MLKRNLFIGLVIFILFTIGLVLTVENINEKQNSLEEKIVD